MPKCLVLLVLLVAGSVHAAAPTTFEDAKRESREHVYQDQSQSAVPRELYCGCKWKWVGRSGGRVDLASCGYVPRAQANRAERIEWEHIVPAYVFGSQRRCWQNGGRKNCNATDPVFNAMEADLHNLAPSVGEVNADRSNYRYGVLPQAAKQYGACETKVDFKGRVAEPRDAVKGMVARVQFYMHDRYDLNMSQQQQRLLMAWSKQFPVTPWELERDRRIAGIVGYSNPFVTGKRQWSQGHRNSKEGIVTPIPGDHPARRPLVVSKSGTGVALPAGSAVVGNRNSKVYHLPQGCPGYDQIAAKNRVPFKSEADARAAGFRKAGKCR
jgi:deoxyribonuclease-1